MPTIFGENRVVHDVGIREIAVPSGIEWKNVMGVTKRGFFGPIYLKTSLAENDRENFWKILQIMCGKPQCKKTKDESELASLCIDLLKNGVGQEALEKYMRYIRTHLRKKDYNEQKVE